MIALLLAATEVLVVPLKVRGAPEETAVLFTGMVAESLGKVGGVRSLSLDEVGAGLTVEQQKQLVGSELDAAKVAAQLGKRYVAGGNVGTIGELALVQLFLMDTQSGDVVARESKRAKGGPEALADAVPEVARALVQQVLPEPAAAPAPPPPAGAGAAPAPGARGRGGGMAPPAGMDRKAMIQRAISRSRGFLAYCYEQELVRDAASAGQVLVRFQIGAGGRVEKVGVDDAGTTLKSDAMKACVEATARAWKFPPVLAESTVTYPFVFRPEGDVPAP